jgi:hypothetical protein
VKDSEFWDNVNKDGPVPGRGPVTPCWLWTRSRTGAGYGNYWSHERKRYELAHRHAYQELVGEIAEGLRLDHSCFIENCVRPEHLTPRTQKGNGERRRGAPSNSSSGIRGVSYVKKTGRWRAYAVHNDRQYGFGSYITKEEAEQAAIEGRERLYA